MESAVFLRRKPEYFKTNQQINAYKTRQARNSHVSQINSKFVKDSPYYSTVKIYNRISEHIKSIQDLNGFKGKVKKHFMERQYYSIQEYLGD